MALQVPTEFMRVSYDYDRHPQSAEFDLSLGANCQLWAYALLRYFGIIVPPFRSSQLWEDTEQSEVANEMKPLDLLLFNELEDSWGAHVAVYLGDGAVAHLSQENRLPEVCPLEAMLQIPKYRVFIGAKRMKGANKPLETIPDGLSQF